MLQQITTNKQKIVSEGERERERQLNSKGNTLNKVYPGETSLITSTSIFVYGFRFLV